VDGIVHGAVAEKDGTVVNEHDYNIYLMYVAQVKALVMTGAGLDEYNALERRTRIALGIEDATISGSDSDSANGVDSTEEG
jgi:hypothetical protein